MRPRRTLLQAVLEQPLDLSIELHNSRRWWRIVMAPWTTLAIYVCSAAITPRPCPPAINVTCGTPTGIHLGSSQCNYTPPTLASSQCNYTSPTLASSQCNYTSPTVASSQCNYTSPTCTTATTTITSACNSIQCDDAEYHRYFLLVE